MKGGGKPFWVGDDEPVGGAVETDERKKKEKKKKKMTESGPLSTPNRDRQA